MLDSGPGGPRARNPVWDDKTLSDARQESIRELNLAHRAEVHQGRSNDSGRGDGSPLSLSARVAYHVPTSNATSREPYEYRTGNVLSRRLSVVVFPEDERKGKPTALTRSCCERTVGEHRPASSDHEVKLPNRAAEVPVH
jgi:hypothetical protein